MWRNITLSLISVLIALILLEGLLRLAGAVFLWQQDLSHRRLTLQNGEYRILCIGESTTALGGEFSYPSQLQKILDKRQVSYHFVVINKGIPSIDTDVILKNLPGFIHQYHPQMIVAMMGINDHAFYATDGWANNLKSIKLIRMIYAHLMERFKKPQKVDLPKFNNPIELARYLESNGEYAQAIKVLDASLARITSQDYFARVLILWELAQCYQSSGDLKNAVKYYQAVLVLVPTHNRAWGDLGETYLLMGVLDQAEFALVKQISIAPREVDYYGKLVSCLEQLGKIKDIEPLLLYGLSVNANNVDILMELGHFYIQQERWAEGSAVLEKVLSLAHNSAVLDGDLVVSLENAYLKMGAVDKFKSTLQKYKKTVNTETQRNFNQLKELAFKNGIALVIMQYPIRELQPLKEMVGESSRIIYVDNSTIFKQSVAKEGYSAYFIDRFGGNFGHASPRGNNLLASNLATSIMNTISKGK